MNVIKLYGGLGNQFYQYAFGRTMEKLGKQVAFEVSFYQKQQNPPRPFGLNKFRIKSFETSSFIPNNTMIHEPQKLFYSGDKKFLELDNVNMFGYWQNNMYFETIFPELVEEFRLKKEYYTAPFLEVKEWIMASEDSISIHVRRGDYIAINGHHNLSIEYYHEALKRVPDGRFFIFSDDIPWCQQNFTGNVVFVDLNEYLSFELMRLCKHNIIANSTFSWWAATLNPNPNKIVVAPIKWRESEEEQTNLNNSKTVPDNWIRL